MRGPFILGFEETLIRFADLAASTMVSLVWCGHLPALLVLSLVAHSQIRCHGGGKFPLRLEFLKFAFRSHAHKRLGAFTSISPLTE